jgi:hypothetical protein
MLGRWICDKLTRFLYAEGVQVSRGESSFYTHHAIRDTHTRDTRPYYITLHVKCKVKSSNRGFRGFHGRRPEPIRLHSG